MMLTTDAHGSEKTADDLEALLRTHGSGLTDAQLKQTREPLGRLRVAPRVFQPRDMQDRRWEKEEHLKELAKAARARRALDPIIIFPIAGERYVVDGHCRLEAYRNAGWQDSRKVPVRYLKGSLTDALTEAVKQNAKDKLRLTREEKSEAAWRLVLYSDTRGCFSLREIAAMTGVGKSTVGNMQTTLREARDKDPESLADLKAQTWREVLRGQRRTEGSEYDEAWEEQWVAEMADTLRKKLGPLPGRQPELFMRALEEAYPVFRREVVEDDAEASDF